MEKEGAGLASAVPTAAAQRCALGRLGDSDLEGSERRTGCSPWRLCAAHRAGKWSCGPSGRRSAEYWWIVRETCCDAEPSASQALVGVGACGRIGPGGMPMRASKPMMTKPLPGLPHLVCEASEVNLGLLATPDRALHVGGGGGGAVEPAVRGVPSDLRRGN